MFGSLGSVSPIYLLITSPWILSDQVMNIFIVNIWVVTLVLHTQRKNQRKSCCYQISFFFISLNHGNHQFTKFRHNLPVQFSCASSAFSPVLSYTWRSQTDFALLFTSIIIFPIATFELNTANWVYSFSTL